MALPYAEESMMICCDVCFYYKLICCLLERNERYERKPFRYNTTTRERQTDGRTDRIPISISRVGIAVLTRDKNRRDCWWQIGLRCKRQEAVRVSSLSNVHADHRTIKSASWRHATSGARDDVMMDDVTADWSDHSQRNLRDCRLGYQTRVRHPWAPTRCIRPKLPAVITSAGVRYTAMSWGPPSLKDASLWQPVWCWRHCGSRELEGHSVRGAHVPPTQSCFSRLAVNKTILTPRVAAATGAEYLYLRFSRRNKISRCSAYDIGESNPVPASGL